MGGYGGGAPLPAAAGRVGTGDRIAQLDIPTGIPLVYELGPDLRPDLLGGQYLDPHAARAAIEVIRNQGRSA